MQIETIGLIVAGVAAAGKIIDETFVTIGPHEVGVRWNRITGELRPVVDLKRPNYQANVVVERDTWCIGLTGKTENGERVRYHQEINREHASALRRGKVENYEELVAQHGVDTDSGRQLEVVCKPVVVIESRNLPRPKQGIVAKVPFLHRMTKISLRQEVVDTEEIGLQTRITMKTTIGETTMELHPIVQPDFNMSFRPRPDTSDEIIRRFPQRPGESQTPLDRFRAAVIGEAKAAAFQVVTDRNYEELTNVAEISDRGRNVFAALLKERGIDTMVDVGDFTFQGVDLGELRAGMNIAATQAIERETLGDDLYRTRTLAGGKGVVVALPSAETGFREATNGAIMQRLVRSGEK